ncbi:MAG: putative Cell wall-associated hydrolase [Blastococcus sp.]|nr:putative Cell wall-associated hydrolase [Blastococcus sp.]
MATPHTVLTHVAHLFHTDPAPDRPTARRIVGTRSVVIAGAAAVLTFSALPGTAGADPGEAFTPQQATQLVAEASHQLEVVTEELNTAKVQLEQQNAEVQTAEQDAADAEKRLDALDGQIRELARTAYTGDTYTELDILLTSDSADDFVSQLGTLDAIAGHTNDQVTQVVEVAEGAEKARAKADEAAAKAQKEYDAIADTQAKLQGQIADYQRQYDALTAPQQRAVVTAHAGESVPVVTSAAASSAAAQTAVDTALAQLGDPYVWGAAGPNSFDCSGLMQYAYSAAGISLPHSSGMQSQMGISVSPSVLQPGDLLFFYSPVSHVGMYIGNGQMVHASTSGSPVKVVSLDYMMDNFSGARRIAG